jgi:hypothetical protein
MENPNDPSETQANPNDPNEGDQPSGSDKAESVSNPPTQPSIQQPTLIMGPGIQAPFNFQVPQPPPPGSPPNNVNAQALSSAITEATKEGNNSEAQVTLQIILVSSAILAILGGFVIGLNHANFGWQVKALLAVSALGLGLSLLAGILHFVSERSFWYKIRSDGQAAAGIVSAVANLSDRENSARQAMNQIDRGSSRIAFWISVVCFIIGVSALLVLVIEKVLSN